jgi:hypothetical protein
MQEGSITPWSIGTMMFVTAASLHEVAGIGERLVALTVKSHGGFIFREENEEIGDEKDRSRFGRKTG